MKRRHFKPFHRIPHTLSPIADDSFTIWAANFHLMHRSNPLPSTGLFSCNRNRFCPLYFCATADGTLPSAKCMEAERPMGILLPEYLTAGDGKEFEKAFD